MAEDVVKDLITRGADVNFLPKERLHVPMLHLLTFRGAENMVDWLLIHGADVHLRSGTHPRTGCPAECTPFGCFFHSTHDEENLIHLQILIVTLHRKIFEVTTSLKLVSKILLPGPKRLSHNTVAADASCLLCKL